MSKMIRVATVKATGKKFIVQQLEFSKNPKAHCWGNLLEYKGLSSKHEGSISFAMKDVEISEVPRTIQLLDAMFMQTVHERRDRGHVLTGRRNVTDHGLP